MRFTTSLAAASLALALLAGPALAQQGAPRGPAGAPGAPAAPGAEQRIPLKPVAPSHLAIAKEVATASGVTRSFSGVVDQLKSQIMQITVTRPELKDDLEQILTEMKPELDLQQQQFINAAGLSFANFLSESELKDIDAFFKTPAGLKYVQAQPQIMDAFVSEFQKWSNGLAEYVMIRTRAELTKRGKKF